MAAAQMVARWSRGDSRRGHGRKRLRIGSWGRRGGGPVDGCAARIGALWGPTDCGRACQAHRGQGPCRPRGAVRKRWSSQLRSGRPSDRHAHRAGGGIPRPSEPDPQHRRVRCAAARWCSAGSVPAVVSSPAGEELPVEPLPQAAVTETLARAVRANPRRVSRVEVGLVMRVSACNSARSGRFSRPFHKIYAETRALSRAKARISA